MGIFLGVDDIHIDGYSLACALRMLILHVHALKGMDVVFGYFYS